MQADAKKGLPKGPTEVVVERAVESYRWVRDYYTAVKNGHYQPFSALERKAREATRNEPWGPTGTMLNELAEESYKEEACYVIFAVVEMRLGYPPEKWRNVYKALTVLEFILKRGSEVWVTLAKGELERKLGLLEEFEFFDEKGHDQGINVRHRSAAIRALLQSPRLLAAEREAAQKKRRQYQGYSRDDLDAHGERQPRSDDLDFRRGSSTFARTTASGDSSPDGSPHGFAQFRNDGERFAGPRQAGQGRGAPPNPGSSSAAAPSGSAPAGRNAGEMKGVTLEDNKRYLAALKAIMARPENRTCADCCGASSSRPTWASINAGVFICMQCAGIHRGLGVHISKVRSCTLDTWLPDQVAFMAATGNATANSYWEATLPPNERPTSGDRSSLSTFIRLKYTGQWAQGTWPPEHSRQAAPTEPAWPVEAPPAPSQQRFSSDAFPTTTVAAPTAKPAPAAAAAAAEAPPSGAGSFWGAFPEPEQAAAPRPTPPPAPQSGGLFWADFQESSRPRPQAAAVLSNPAPAPAPQQQAVAPPQPMVMFDLLSFDELPAFTPATALPATPTVRVAAGEMNLLNFDDSPRAANGGAASSRATATSVQGPPPARPPAPAEPLYSNQQSPPQQHPAPASDLQLLEQLSHSPNLMDHADLYGAEASVPPSTSGVNGAFGSGAFNNYPESQHTGRESIVPGLDDLLSYQYTGADYHSSRLDELPPARSSQMSSTSQLAYGSAAVPPPSSTAIARHSIPPRVVSAQPPQKHLQAESNLSRAGLSASSSRGTWQNSGGQGRAGAAGMSVFDTLQEEVLSTYHISSSPGGKRMSSGNAQPMRAPMR
eukprot:CAMPEP_0117676278 /NCGR_PEP_ID=MMETSP0804-20121206/16072_1 /TAXON_ID=1074897 /ORGANISM="Tetraselmis astigmatica, Strain CCMP880" /LENGTH=827 /DNA_ID=CAMNT_0005485375 /DNA_START=220 /DNA_END=2703 /DNA_ORIENTATION=+